MYEQTIRDVIQSGHTALGMELGSTRIKAVLVGMGNEPLASGSHTWENRYVDGVWTYTLDDVWEGVADCYADLARDVLERYGVALETVGSIGFSAMMHGLLCFNDKDELLTPFRTWRNVMTQQAAAHLTEVFSFNVPIRWSVAHLWQDIVDAKPWAGQVSFFTTLAGYVHWMCTGEKVLGVGDASGMFPIDSATKTYDARMISLFNEQAALKGCDMDILKLLPEVRVAGQNAGMLTEEGARRLDPSGKLRAGIPVCPPEGDAGTGMTATNSVAPRTGNVSAGTSIFAMIVLEKALNEVHPEIDVVTTPSGDPVAMVHCNTGTSDIDAWVHLVQEIAGLFGAKPSMAELYGTLYNKALDAAEGCGGLVAYNYYAGEVITDIDGGAPLLMRSPDSALTVANLMRALLNSSLATLRLGMDILAEEDVRVDRIAGHGGLFKTPVVGQTIMANALGSQVEVQATAGEGGAWGIALLAAFMMRRNPDETLASFLDREVFAGVESTVIAPTEDGERDFDAFLERYRAGLPAEKAAVEALSGSEP